MKKKIFGAAIILAAAFAFTGASQAQNSPMPIPGVDAVVDVPGAGELPDKNLTYKLVFDLDRASETMDKVNPGLTFIAHYINTLAKYGVPESHRKMVVVFHQQGTWAILTDAAYQAKYKMTNPNIALMNDMKRAGVDFRVCGQSVHFNKIERSDIQSIVQVDLWAGTTITTLIMRGYAHISANFR